MNIRNIPTWLGLLAALYLVTACDRVYDDLSGCLGNTIVFSYLAALVSCQSKGTQNNDAVAMDESVMAVTGNDSSAVAVYEGILPAADGPGIQYVLSVDSVGPDGESGYTLVTTYLDAEGPGKNKSFTSEGKKEVIQKDVDNKKKTAIKLTPNDGVPQGCFFQRRFCW